MTSERIQEFLDGGLTPAEEAPVREHLSACPRCQAEAEGWKVLFSELGSLPGLELGHSMADAVMARVAVRRTLGARASRWFGAGKARDLAAAHIPVGEFQDLLDGSVGRRRKAGAETHLAACGPCRRELRGWERLFASLSSLGRFAPSAGFRARVMASVRVPSPVPAPWLAARRRALAWASGFLPRTRKGWAVAGGVASAPTITVAALIYLVFSHSLLTVGTLTTWLSWKASEVFGAIASSVGSAVVESVTLFKAYSILGAMAKSPLWVGVGGLVFSLMSAAALWVLYRNLVATPSVDRRYARARV